MSLLAPVRGSTTVGEPKSGYVPAVGDLVIQDTTVSNGYDKCADTEVPAGIVRKVLNTDNQMLIEQFTAGVLVYLPYSGSPALGNGVVSDATGEAVKPSGSVGDVVLIGEPLGTVAVRF
jgi:hypothetical protein